VSRVALSRLPSERVRVVDPTGRTDLDAADLPAYVAARERTDPPRWVWDDTARWYPPLLAAGVRVERCHDLRLGHHLLRRAPALDVSLLEGEESGHWHRLGPAAASDPVLFSADDAAEHLDAALEDERQRAAVAASPEAGRLSLLLAAESSGALVAAEMTHAGVPWRVDVHERILTALLGPRPPRGARPQLLEDLAGEVRAALASPRLNPDSRPELLAALRRAGLEVTDTRSWTLRRLDHPAVEPLLRYKKLAHLFTTNGWSWIDAWVRHGRFRPVYQPAGSATGRWSSAGGGALSFPAQVRSAAVADDGWVLVVADVAQLEPRVLAGMSGDRALARAASGADLYQGMVDAGAVATRDDAKLGLLGAMYGATTGGSGRMLADLTRRYPAAFGLVEDAARAGEQGRVVRTLLGRGSPRSDDGLVGRRSRGRRRRGRRRPRRRDARPQRPVAARLRPVHPQLRRPGHGRGVGAVLDRRPPQPAVAPRRRRPAARAATAPGVLPARRGRRPRAGGAGRRRRERDP
jgi:DNA polymerase-1